MLTQLARTETNWHEYEGKRTIILTERKNENGRKLEGIVSEH